MLLHFGVIPYVVFDGDYLPSKAATEVERAKRREESKRKGLELYRLHKPSQAHLELQKAVDVTPEMARQLIEELKKIGIQYVVAPYEADAQLAYLERQGIIQGMLSEDSDLLVFGAKCLLTKLDQYGDCVEINRADFTACRDISLVGWSDTEFRRMAILSGCDYLASISRMGLKSAYRLVRKYKTIEKILRMLQFDGQYRVPPGYLEAFYQAEQTFLHQRVFCPVKNDIVMLTEVEVGEQPEEFSFIGAHLEQHIAIGVAKGDLDPMKKQPLRIKDTVNSTPKTPWGNPRRNTVDICFDPKPNQTIESFFKAKRTPLAELDPNSFTPSPTQERLLQQANRATWQISPAPVGPPTLRASASMPSTMSRPALSSRMSDIITSTGSGVTGGEFKRRRLCLDSEDSQDFGNSVKSDFSRSRFFTADITYPSPSVKSRKQNKRVKDKDIAIWSDDSVNDVMAGLPDVSIFPEPTKRGRLQVFKDSDEKESKDAPRLETQNKDAVGDSQSSTNSKGTERAETSTSTSVMGFTSSTPSVATTLEKHVTAELKALTQKYTYQPETQQMATQRVDFQDLEKRALREKNEQTSKPDIIIQRSMTPLQRLGAGALNRRRSYSKLDATAVTGSSRLDKDPSEPRLPSTLRMRPDGAITKGSEDTIIPDSEDDHAESVCSTSEVEEQVKPTIDFGRFVFTR